MILKKKVYDPISLVSRSCLFCKELLKFILLSTFTFVYICSFHPVLCCGHVLLLLEDGEVAGHTPVVVVGNNN